MEFLIQPIVALLIFGSHQSYSFLLRFQKQPIVSLPIFESHQSYPFLLRIQIQPIVGLFNLQFSGGSHGPTTDNLCFFRCSAVHRGAPNVTALETPAMMDYREYLQQQDMTPADFQGVTLDDLVYWSRYSA